MLTKLTTTSVLAIAVAGLGAQCGTNSGNPYYQLYGNNWLGGYVRAASEAESNRYTGGAAVELGVGLAAGVKLLKESLEVLDLGYRAYHLASSTSTFHLPSDNLRVKFVGLTLWNGRAMWMPGSDTGLYPNISIPLDVFPVDPAATVPVGPIVLTLRGNAGATVVFGGSVTMPPSVPKASLQPYAGCYLFGRARVGVGVPGFSVGVELDGRLANQALSGRFDADARTCSFSSSLRYDLTAISLRLKAYVEAFWVSWTETLVSWSTARRSWSLF